MMSKWIVCGHNSTHAATMRGTAPLDLPVAEELVTALNRESGADEGYWLEEATTCCINLATPN
jgi:hypothetical protein